MMNYAKFRLVSKIGQKLLYPFQLRRLSNYALYRIVIPFVRKWGPDRLVFSPPNVVISITSRCNKQCNFCYFRGELNQDDADRLEMSYEKFLEIINHPSVAKGLRIALTGGEPLLNKDIFKMIREAKKRGFIVSVVTNGKLLHKRRFEILDTPPDLLAISYHHDDRGYLAGILPLFTKKISVKLNFALTQSNMKQLENLFEIAASNNVCMVDIEHANLSNHPQIPELPIPPKSTEYSSFKAKMGEKYNRNLAISWGPIIGNNKNKEPKCRVFWHSIHIDAIGQISPCCQWPLSTYQENIFANTDAWNSESMASLRDQMRNNKVPRFCKDCCFIYDDYLGI